VAVSRVLVDTSAYSAHLRGQPEVKATLQRAAELCVSAISLGELRAGFRKGTKVRQNEGLLQRFLASPRVRVVPVDEETADRYAVIHDQLRRAGTPVGSNDLWIAASALQHGLRLLTLDADFQRIPGLVVDFIPSR
jgi:tRNA(fMet)-specific endonuclease VapC